MGEREKGRRVRAFSLISLHKVYFFPLWRPRSWREALRIGGVAFPMCFVERIGFFIDTVYTLPCQHKQKARHI